MSELIRIIVGTIGLAVFGIAAGMLMQGVDRILAARMQSRIGPPLQQPWWDLLKLLSKNNVVPDNAIAWIFNGAPLVAFASAVTVLLYLPMAGFAPVLGLHGDLILVIYLLAVPALAMMAGGFASGSPYATIGAQREMVTMIAYELPLAATVIAFAWKLANAGVALPFALTSINANPIWEMVGPVGGIGVALLFMAMLAVTPAKLGKAPMDTPEAKSELADGLLVEYSGRNLAMYYLSLAVKMVIMSALTVLLFIPWNISDFMSCPCTITAAALDIVFFAVKVFFVMFISVTLARTAMARFRITQVFELYWKYIGIMSLVGLALIMLDAKI
ncbi:MAG TPA: complex I subunit 1 family protein [Tichowtungia sp.]|nr:complex I subunit 1 family protein [Tichowtungia sp.]